MYLAKKIVFIIIFLGLLISALIVDNDFFRKGWELPKVAFWHQVILLVFCVFAFSSLYGLITRKIRLFKMLQNNLFFFFITAVFLFYLILFLISSCQLREPNTLGHNPILSTLANIFNPKININLFGNEFRDFGMVTIGFILIFLFILLKNINRLNYQFLTIALIISCTIQSIIGISQFISLLSIDLNLIAKGEYIYGSFGQSNFYAGHLLAGCLLLLKILLNNKIYFKNYYQIFFRAFIKYIFILNIFALLISFSYWGIFSLLIGICLMILNNQTSLTKFSIYLKKFLITFVIIFIPVSLLFIGFFKSFEQRIIIWRDVYFLYTGQGDSNLSLSELFFGSGPDTLGVVLNSNGKLQGLYIDRGHNILIDILASFGILGLVIFISLFLILLFRILRTKDKQLNYMFIILIALSIRLLVNTYSIINIIDIVIILSICLFMLKENRCKVNNSHINTKLS